ncbi:transcriptional repressor DicA [Pseudomonas sp. SCT]|uniref:Helix-turn-helix domain-containing protein n=1 Tax=Stutzerimonas stutzeri TaxID=316 RepID=A0AA42HBN8_STUST|nr:MULTISPECIES: helix-turn-helix transcriptional regulator [Pseudomonadaceae]MDH0149192.1 helix-turn-helix domain-containing protein [Stutzerimonas stutzeri]MDH0153644.1 helix-turn-helix domain-containing protein [Stutzerimonas stutzeri]GCA55501.1 transcriptional repressor DicA [Pseudomonas sp. SCT]GCA55509.1 transcriptional repressor DicA [Pseudomonas sp. SCT]
MADLSDPGRATMSVGENIRQKRESMKLSQDGLASLIGSTAKTVARWESDANFPGGDAIINMAHVFGCSTDEILLERSEREISPEMRALFRRFGDLPDELKPMARGMIGAILASLEEEAARKTAA